MSNTITITLNGQTDTYNASTPNITNFLHDKGFADKKVAVAINGQFIPKSSYDEHIINENDDVEIVAPMQGG
jgi:sulfur carrier protein